MDLEHLPPGPAATVQHELRPGPRCEREGCKRPAGHGGGCVFTTDKAPARKPGPPLRELTNPVIGEDEEGNPVKLSDLGYNRAERRAEARKAARGARKQGRK